MHFRHLPIIIRINSFFYEQSSPRKENEVVSHGSSGAFQVYRRPAAANNVPSAVPNPSATPEKRLAASVNTPASTKGLSSVIEEHRRRGEVLRKQQQLLSKHLFDIQVGNVSMQQTL